MFKKILPCIQCIVKPICFQGINELPKDPCLEYAIWRSECRKYWQRIRRLVDYNNLSISSSMKMEDDKCKK